MPKPALSDEGRSRGSAVASITDRPKKKRSRKKRTHQGPAIMPSQSVHHGTPPIVLDGVVYPVLGCPVAIDPCSNESSIVQARRHVRLPENGLEIPWHGTVYCNPPYGMPEILLWIRKCIIEHRKNGAEIIALLPAHTSSSWFDLIAATAAACFFWGPGAGLRRVKHIGNEDAAAFDSCLVYWGSNLAAFTSHAGRFAHPWYPTHDLRLMRALIGDTRVPDGPALSIASADELLALGRNDDLVAALASLGSATVGDVLDAGDTLIRSRLRRLPAYELAVALLCASRSSPRSWLDHRLPGTPRPMDPRQLGLLPSDVAAPTSAFPRTPEPGPPPALDDAVLEEIQRAAQLGTDVASEDLLRLFSCSAQDLRNSLRRLARQGAIIKHGRKDAFRYTTKQEEQDATRQ